MCSRSKWKRESPFAKKKCLFIYIKKKLVDHANVDMFSLRNARIDCCISSDRYAPTRAVLLGSETSIGVSRTSSF